MQPVVANLNDYRRRKSKARVFEALEYLHMEMLARLEDPDGRIDPAEFEEFMIQVLGDHLAGELENTEDIQQLDENYRRFDSRLRECLQTKLKSLRHFERMRKR